MYLTPESKWWVLTFRANERAWTYGRYHKVLTDDQIVGRFLDVFPEKLYLEQTYEVYRYRKWYNKGMLDGSGHPPESASYRYDRRQVGIYRLICRCTPRGKPLLWEPRWEIVMNVRKVSAKTDKGETKAVDAKKATRKETQKAEKATMRLQDFCIELMKRNAKQHLTDTQLASEVRAQYPGKRRWEDKEVAPLTFHAYRVAYNKGALTGGEVPATLSHRYGEDGQVDDPTRGPKLGTKRGSNDEGETKKSRGASTRRSKED